MAEAALNRKGHGQLVAESAGSHPASAVHPMTIEVLAAAGMNWDERRPRGLSEVATQSWDLVITLCDRAREMCPMFPNRPVAIHWGIPDPTVAPGSATDQRRAFADALAMVTRRVDLLLALPFEQLEALALSQQVDAITEATTDTPPEDTASSARTL